MITFSVMCAGSALQHRPGLACACLLVPLLFCHSKRDVRLCPGVLHARFQHVCNSGRGVREGPAVAVRALLGHNAQRAELKSLLKQSTPCFSTS